MMTCSHLEQAVESRFAGRSLREIQTGDDFFMPRVWLCLECHRSWERISPSQDSPEFDDEIESFLEAVALVPTCVLCFELWDQATN